MVPVCVGRGLIVLGHFRSVSINVVASRKPYLGFITKTKGNFHTTWILGIRWGPANLGHFSLASVSVVAPCEPLVGFDKTIQNQLLHTFGFGSLLSVAFVVTRSQS